MGQEFRISEESGGKPSDGDSGVFPVTYRDYNKETDKYSLPIMIDKFFLEAHNEDINVYREVQGGLYSGIECQMVLWDQEKCSYQIAQKGNKPVGFMVYNLIYECILIVRAIYFEPEYRLKSHLRRMILGVGDVKHIYSMTYAEHEPKEIRGQKPKRHLIHTTKDNLNIWFNDNKRKVDGSTNDI